MKKITALTIVIWSILFVVGLTIGLIGSFTTAPDWIMWLIAILIWLADGIWILISFLPKKKKSSGAAFIGNQTVFNKIVRETEEAVYRYTDAVNRKGLLKKSALYERPWFIICGTSKSGKSSLLKGSGLNFPLKYPSERDGLLVEGSNQIMWYFANEAVWVDTPGAFMDDGAKDDWKALIASLKKVRPIVPVDGVALVVNTNEVLNSDDQGIKELAKRLRSRIDELISLLGIEFPVYLLFNRTDEVPGFNEYFGEQLERGQDQIFGATLSTKTQSAMPRLAFAEEFNILCKSLTDLRLDKLYKERSEAKKRMICRFVIHFEGIQQKLGSLVAELFRPSSYEGKPIFRGFYFTSCYEKLPEITSARASSGTSTSVMSATIINHPLNPNRAFSTPTPGTAPQKTPSKNDVKSVFVLPLFREIMVKDKSLVKSTQKRTRQEMIRHYSIIGIIVIIGILLSAFIFTTQRNANKFMNEIKSELANLPPENAPLLEQYIALDMTRKTIAKLQKYEDHGVPLSMGIGFYRGRTVLNELKKTYFYRIKRFMIIPSVKYLEYDISERSQVYGELAGDSYDSLYRSLKGYLLLSEAAPKDPKELDTLLLRPVLLDAIKQSILATVNASRLPTQIETILSDNMGLFLMYFRRGEFPKIQENQNLVNNARQRLSRLPSASALYEAVINKLVPDAPLISLDQILKREGEGILKSNQQISVLYTQEGWQQFVSDAISEAVKNPFKTDWVIGASDDQSSDVVIDKKQLRSAMVEAYAQDCKEQWLSFLGSIDMDPFGDLDRSSRILQKLVSANSELSTLFETVSNYTVLKDESDAEKAGGSALEAASKLKATKGLAKNFDKAEKQFNFSLGSSSPFDNNNALFDKLRAFARSTSGAMGGYEGYKDKVLSLSEKLATIQSQGEAQAVVIFNGKDSDPLFNGWKYTQSALTSMPEELAAALRNILLKPFEYTGSAASVVLAKTVNAQWQNEVVKPFTSRFSGRYPFSLRGEDASFNDVMDFFRPSNGVYWGFYDRVLSSYVSKEQNGWTSKNLGSIQLEFSPAIFSSLAAAERIRDIFFKNDGTLRSLDITMSPGSSNKNTARIEVAGQIVDLIPGGRAVHIKWPIESNPSATLKIQVGNDFSQEVSYNGLWGFMKLIQAGKVNKLNSSSFNTKWQVNIQNMYMIYIDSHIQVAGSDHPFSDPVFQDFSCPTNLVSIKKGTN